MTVFELVGVQLSIVGERSKIRFKLLELRKLEIEAAIGASFQWRELPDYKESQVRIVRDNIDPKQQENWSEICGWLIQWTENFSSVFQPIVKELDTNRETFLEDV